MAVGQRPEELQNALVQLQSRTEPPDLAFPIICSTLASAAADVEIAAIEELGTLAVTIFGRIAQGGEAGASGLFAAEAMAGYAASIGSTVDTSQVHNMVDRMIGANLIMRQSHGVYAVSDPIVRQVWLQRGPGVSAAEASGSGAGWVNCSACYPARRSGTVRLPDLVRSHENATQSSLP